MVRTREEIISELIGSVEKVGDKISIDSSNGIKFRNLIEIWAEEDGTVHIQQNNFSVFIMTHITDGNFYVSTGFDSVKIPEFLSFLRDVHDYLRIETPDLIEKIEKEKIVEKVEIKVESDPENLTTIEVLKGKIDVFQDILRSSEIRIVK